MDERSRPMLAAAGALIGLQAVGTAVAVARRWPAQFGGPGDPDGVAREFLTRGTPFSAPLGLLASYAVATAAAAKPGRTGRVGAVAVAAGSCVFVVGFLGEALSPHTGQVPRRVLWTSSVLGAGLSAWTASTAVRVLRADHT